MNSSRSCFLDLNQEHHWNLLLLCQTWPIPSEERTGHHLEYPSRIMLVMMENWSNVTTKLQSYSRHPWDLGLELIGIPILSVLEYSKPVHHGRVLLMLDSYQMHLSLSYRQRVEAVAGISQDGAAKSVSAEVKWHDSHCGCYMCLVILLWRRKVMNLPVFLITSQMHVL